MKLRTKVSIVSTTFIVLVVALLTVFQLNLFNRYGERAVSRASTEVADIVLQQLKVRADYTADYLTESLINPIYRYDMEGIYRLLSPALQQEELKSVVVFDPEGRVMHTGDERAINYGRTFDQSEIITVVINEGSSFERHDGTVLEVARPLYIGNEILGGLYLRYSLTSIDERIWDVKRIFKSLTDEAQSRIRSVALIAAFGLAVLGSLLSVKLARRVIEPVNALAQQARRIALGADDIQNSIYRGDEIGELASSLNEMAQTLRKRTDVIEFLAYNDHLTRLPNRTQFMDELNNAVLWAEQNETNLAVYFIDLDEFKGVNDNYGHHVGDSLLIEVSQRIRELVEELAGASITGSEIDSMLARVGGDEFLMMTAVPDSPELPKTLATRILALLNRPFTVGEEGDTVVVKASIGIAHFPVGGETANMLIRNADIAMYAAKADGKHTYCVFSEDMAEEVQRKAILERDLRKALATENPGDQLQLWIQPQVDLVSGELLGAEALIRWVHPERGIILPGDFIPVAESTGLILPLGELIVEQACALLARWKPNIPKDFYLAINLSAKQFYRQSLPEIFTKYLAMYDIAPSLIHLEVTESLLMRNENKAKENLDALRDFGFELWLDDFGVGYSSLSYLREFKIDGLKIDKSFVADIGRDPDDSKLCAGIMLLARELGIRVVAEGIERIGQVDFLRSRLCYVGQGLYFAGPLPPVEFEQRYMNGDGTVATV